MATPSSRKALAESKVAGINKTTNFRVDPDLVKFEEGFNLRMDEKATDAHIEHLYQAMKAGAFVPPIDVSIVEGEIIVRDGHCRTRAARKLKEEIPDYTLECRQLRGNDADAVLHMLGTGSGGKPLSPLEQGKGFLRLITMGLKPTDIATRLGVSRVTIDNGLTLAEAPAELQQMIAKGEVSSTTARDAIKQGKEGIKALKEAVKVQREAPAPAAPKKGKAPAAKKKVTAKVLKGTAAEKKTKAAPIISQEYQKVENGLMDLVIAATDPNKVTITFDIAEITEVMKFLKDDCDENDAVLQSVAKTIELALI